MQFHKIDLEHWPRKECFEHFMTVAQSTYSITVDMDLTRLMDVLHRTNRKLYPTFTWIVSRAINQQQEFKMGYDENGTLGYYDMIYPDYAVLDEKTKIMDSLSTPYVEDYNEFYQHMRADMEAYHKNGAHTEQYPNFFVVSCLPWLKYSSFTAMNESKYKFLFPMVTWGKYVEVKEKVIMPVTLQIHHAVADGYHCSLFYQEVEQVLQNPEKYLE